VKTTVLATIHNPSFLSICIATSVACAQKIAMHLCRHAAATTCPTPFRGSPRRPPHDGGGGRAGVTVGVLNTLCELAWELTTTTRFRLPSGRVTRRARHSDYREMRSFLILFLICTFLPIHIFYCTRKKVCLLYISSCRTVDSVICTFESHSKLSSFVHT
jgi:hypothetical protein